MYVLARRCHELSDASSGDRTEHSDVLVSQRCESGGGDCRLDSRTICCSYSFDRTGWSNPHT
jgi:hypothetical protein